jgi:hippurate hydrolase
MSTETEPYLAHTLSARVGEFIQLRRDIHAHPELGFEEHRTAALVADKLRQWGYEVHTGLGVTGVVGTLCKGKGERRLGLRADMDALPMQEAHNKAWASTYAGRMHACGHDGHTAMLLAAAQALAVSDEVDGTLHLIFQPAEEGGGGAVRMMQDGLFERFPCDAVFAMHNLPGVAAGHLVFREGAAMASSDYATITLQGRGGHGAMPHLAQDPLVAAASVVMALQTIVSRNVDPQQMAVVTVGALHAGQANNVIADQAVLELSVRALDPQVRTLLGQRIRELVQAQAQSFGVHAQVDWREGYCVLVNTPKETELARRVGKALLGESRITSQGPALTASEDFAFMLQRVPGSYVFIGNGEHDGPGGCSVHNPHYDFNDNILAIGAAYWQALVKEYFSGEGLSPR